MNYRTRMLILQRLKKGPGTEGAPDLDTVNQIIGDSQMLQWVLTGAT